MRLPARQRVLRLTAFSSENRRKYAVFCAKRDEQLGWWCTQQQRNVAVTSSFFRVPTDLRIVRSSFIYTVHVP